MPNESRLPDTLAELIPYIEEHGFHIHYSFTQRKWSLVGESTMSTSHCRPETCYRLRIKNHREEKDGD